MNDETFLNEESIENKVEENFDDEIIEEPDKDIKDPTLYENYGTLKALMAKNYHSIEKQKELLKAAKNGDRSAADELVLSNVRLVAKIAGKYSVQTTIMDFDDFVIEGTAVLYHAIENFDITKIDEIAFTTYATFWIKQAIGRYAQYCTPAVRLPAHAARGIYTLKNRIESFKKEMGFDPSIEELETICKENNIPIENAKCGINILGSTSIYTRIGEGQESELIDCLSDHDTNVEREAISNLYPNSVIDSISDCLSERELIVIKKRMGYGCEHMTLEMVGAELGVTRERIRQIEISAFKKIHRKLRCQPILEQTFRDDLDMYA